jgi:protein phosphatase
MAQEDHLLLNPDRGIFVVADGFGGPASGLAAAKLACESIQGFLFKEAGDLDATLPFELRPYFSLAGNVLFNAIVHANRKLTKHNSGRNVNEKGGAAVLAGFLDGDLLALANVGGCTGWLMRGGAMIEIVTPRTFGKLCDPFATSDCDPGNEVWRVPLTALGMFDNLEPEIFECRLRPGDWVLLHTDGISSGMREALLAIQGEGEAPQAAGDRALELLRTGHSVDNASALLIQF